MPRVRQRQLRQVVDVHLRLVRPRADDPVAVLADPYALARLLELEVLQQLDAVGVFWVLLEAALALARDPFGKGAGGVRAGDCVHGHGRVVGELHVGRSRGKRPCSCGQGILPVLLEEDGFCDVKALGVPKFRGSALHVV